MKRNNTNFNDEKFNLNITNIFKYKFLIIFNYLYKIITNIFSLFTFKK